jgi:probable F420-dependent oxidoreductase
MDQARDHLGEFGIWRGWHALSPDLAAAIEAAGYGTLWVGSSPDGDLATVEELLAATSTLVLGTSIVNVKPYGALADYLETLLAAGVPASGVVVAALGPRVLRLSGERAGGAIPYLVTAEHTRQAKEILGAGPLLAPEHKVVLDTDPQRARETGRPRVAKPYLGLVNYTSNLRRLGWSEADLANGGSDALIDALVLHGTAGEVAAGLREHLAAGADHVVVQLLTRDDGELLVPGYQKLAGALGL